MSKNSICVLTSGGLDSAVLLGESARKARVYPIYVRQGLAWEKAELYWLRRFIKTLHNPRVQPLQVMDLPMADVYGKHWSVGKGAVPGAKSDDRAVYLPGRNLVLLVKAAVFCALHHIKGIALGSLGHNPFPDASPRFFKMWSRTLQTALKSPIVIKAPYRALSKVQVLRRGSGFPLHLSFSCIAPVGTQHCGRCNKCAERRRAFKDANLKDATVYAQG